MIEDIAKANGLVVARTASEKTKRLSTVIKELLNERLPYFIARHSHSA